MFKVEEVSTAWMKEKKNPKELMISQSKMSVMVLYLISTKTKASGPELMISQCRECLAAHIMPKEWAPLSNTCSSDVCIHKGPVL